MTDADLLLRMAKAEDDLATLIARKALSAPADKRKFMRSLWQLSRSRADLYLEMANECN